MFTLLPLLLGPPAAAAEPADWIGTRWYLAVEEVLPIEVNLEARQNYEFILKALQMRAVVDCHDAEAVGKQIVVTCRFEDVAIQAIPHGETPTEQEIDNSQKVLEDVVDRLVGSDLEVTFNKTGKVTRVDVIMDMGPNTRHRRSRERIRQLATDLATGWTIRRPKKWEGTWQEVNTPLARVPAVPPAGGSSLLVHSAAEVDGRIVVQSQGSGLAAAYYQPWEFESQSRVARNVVNSGSAISSGGNGPATVSGQRVNVGTTPGGAAPVGSTPEIQQWDVFIRSVAVPEGDWLAERVWTVAGAGTPSSVNSFQGVNLWYNGRLRKLEPGEKPDLGPTQMVSPPGYDLGLPPWDWMDD